MANIDAHDTINAHDADLYGAYYDGEELEEEIASLRPSGPEGRPTWAYLVFLGLLFVVLIVTSWACSGGNEPATDAIDGSATSASSVLTLSVDEDIATLRGPVPDDETRVGLEAIVADSYEAASVVDGITIDGSATLEDGSIRVTGIAADGDERPDQVKRAIMDAYGLKDGGTELQDPGAAIMPSDVEVRLSPDALVMTGQVPDQGALANLTDAGRAYWPAEGVNSEGVSVSDRTTLEGATVRLTGSLLPGDERASQLESQLSETLGSGVTVDASGVTTDESSESLEAVEDELVELLQADPILFAPESAEIESVSDEVLQTVASKLNAVPSARVEIVGHTDDLGPDDENLALSIKRAESVQARMVELGVDASRMTTRGEGETKPLVDEATPEAREQNRRIEFILVAS